MDSIGFIGLGTMGAPMATNLARAGVALVVHDTSDAALRRVAALPGVYGCRLATRRRVAEHRGLHVSPERWHRPRRLSRT